MMLPAPLIIRRPSPQPSPRAIWIGRPLIDYGPRAASARGLYRIFNAAGFRFYRSSTPPAPGDTPFATSATLPYQPSTTFADGTWYLSVSYFNGVLDSGFLPLGPRGETYLALTLSGGAVAATLPSSPLSVQLLQIAGGIPQVIALYSPAADGTNAADTWSIGYTTDGTTPASNTPTATQAMRGSNLALLAYSLPAQSNGTVVKLQLQTRRGAVYSTPGAVLSLTINTTAPASPAGLQSWPGQVSEGI